jgi:transposase
MPITKPPYPAQFRQQMVELVQAGRKPGDLAKEFGRHITSILSWVRKAQPSSGAASPTDAGPLSAVERKRSTNYTLSLRNEIWNAGVHVNKVDTCDGERFRSIEWLGAQTHPRWALPL